jgi:two-component system response regulator NreC
MKKINLMLVDDHEMIRSGLKSLLQTEDDLVVVGEASNGAEALEKIANLRPDVVVMDISMPVMDGLETTKRMTRQFPESAILVLTVHEDKQYFFQMLQAGAKGYVTKEAAADELVAAIRSVADGHVYLLPALARWLLEDYTQLAKQNALAENDNADTTGLEVLSAREREVLELVAQGNTTPRIAEVLDLSPKTISRHRERIMNKLNMHSTAELVKFAIRTGLVRVN